jgi:hypothetical protein
MAGSPGRVRGPPANAGPSEAWVVPRFLSGFGQAEVVLVKSQVISDTHTRRPALMQRKHESLRQGVCTRRTPQSRSDRPAGAAHRALTLPADTPVLKAYHQALAREPCGITVRHRTAHEAVRSFIHCTSFRMHHPLMSQWALRDLAIQSASLRLSAQTTRPNAHECRHRARRYGLAHCPRPSPRSGHRQPMPRRARWHSARRDC